MKNYNKGNPGKYLKLIKRKKFSEALRIMEPQVPLNMEDEAFFYNLSLCCFMTGDIGGAFSYCNRARSIDPENTDVHLIRALIHIKKREKKEAIAIWLRILDIEPDNKKAKFSLNYVKDSLNDDSLLKSLTYTTLRKMVNIPASYNWVIYLFTTPLILLLTILSFLHWGRPFLNSLESLKNDDQRISDIHLDYNFNKREVLELSGDFLYNLSEKEVELSYNRAVDYFNNFNDNMTQYEINKIKYSNAAEALKSRAVLLEGYLKEPGFSTLKTEFSYNDVINDLFLYEKCYVKWKGKITNYTITEDNITFDFLIGYEKEEVLQGILPVTFDFEILIDPDLPVELIAQIQISDYNPELKGISIRQLIINDEK